MKVFIADDEEPARERLKELLGDIAEETPTTVVGEARNGLETLERLPETGAELLLLDIQMPGLGGLEVARHLAGLPSPPTIVFVTAHDRHAVEAFELNALDYLLKPVRAERLAAALRKATVPAREQLARAAQNAREYLSVAERNRIVLVPVREIVFLRAEQKYVTLRTREREHLIEEVGRVQPLSLQPALHVHESQRHGVDRAGLDAHAQLLERQQLRSVLPSHEASSTITAPSAQRSPRLTRSGEPTTVATPSQAAPV